MTITVAAPNQQIDFAAALAELRGRYLLEALRQAVLCLPVPAVDRELEAYVPSRCLSSLAARGMRGEAVFPVPVVLAANPYLIGFYRLLYGYSQKEFYTAASGIAPFKRMEEKGVLPPNLVPRLPALCAAMCEAGALLLNGIGADEIASLLLHELTLLTLGPQLRGGANVRRGGRAIREVFDAIHHIVGASAVETSHKQIKLINAAGRAVSIEFASDPDIVIKTEMQPGQFRLVVAIEVKGGADFSNIHNRIGEAEKSHQKARNAGYTECWTVHNVTPFDHSMARAESPTTSRFYKLSDLISQCGDDYEDFKNRVISLSGIR